MDKKRKTRYLLAVYSIIAALAIIFGLLGINYAKDTWRSILLNLATELLGVAFVFFLVNYLFLVDDWSISERIEKLLSRLELTRPSAKDFFQTPPSIDSYVQSANQIDMCGVTLTSTINKQLNNMRERLRKGAHIRLLVVNPDSLALQMSALRSKNPDVDYFRKRLETTFEDLEILHKLRTNYRQADSPSRTGSLSVRLLSYAPSFGIYHFDGSRSNGVVFVEIYPHESGFGSAPIFNLTLQVDGKWYEYFVDQFEEMWQSARPWQPSSVEDAG